MNLSELLSLGIVASIGGEGGLRLDAPKGALTADLIERIRHCKPGLIAEINAARDVGELGELHSLCTNPAGGELNTANNVHREAVADTRRCDPARSAESSVRSEVRTEKAFPEPRQTAFIVVLPGRAPFGVSCPQGYEAVSEQWPTATSIIPS